MSENTSNENTDTVLVDSKMLELLVCPVTKGPLVFHRDAMELNSIEAGLAYPIREGIPIMLPDEARALTEDEIKTAKGRK